MTKIIYEILFHHRRNAFIYTETVIGETELSYITDKGAKSKFQYDCIETDDDGALMAEIAEINLEMREMVRIALSIDSHMDTFNVLPNKLIEDYQFLSQKIHTFFDFLEAHNIRRNLA